jgi:filamentous hemagglutinin
MVKRGWTPNDVDDMLSNPAEKRESWDRRHNPRAGTRNNEPATVYYRSDGHYVVRNDNTGEIIQESNTQDPNLDRPIW